MVKYSLYIILNEIGGYFMKMPFFPDIVKVKKDISLLYLAMLFVIIINVSIFVTPPGTTNLFVTFLSAIVGYICGRSQYNRTGAYGTSILQGILAMISIIDIVIVLYIFLKNKKYIAEIEGRTQNL